MKFCNIYKEPVSVVKGNIVEPCAGQNFRPAPVPSRNDQSRSRPVPH
jgi:hypothetical protein